MWNHAAASIVLNVEDRAFAGRKRVEIGNAKREAADRASFDLDVDGRLRGTL
jgi:hypothetical protein